MPASRGLGSPGRAVVKLKLKNIYSLLLFGRTPIADHWLREAKICKTHLLTFSSDEVSRDRFSAVSKGLGLDLVLMFSVSASCFLNCLRDWTFFLYIFVI